MKKIIVIIFFIMGCGSNNNSTNKQDDSNKVNNHGLLEAWQVNSLGQEGHGGDAIVCFNIPISQAIEKVQLNFSEENEKVKENCKSGQVCSLGSGNASWRLTPKGRKSIASAKPLEQYLAERIKSKSALIKKLNSLSVEDGYKLLIRPLGNLPGAYEKLANSHNELGWLEEDGISSEYGLSDVNDSGFAMEIDKTKCKELQAVVRRDNQLWYDKDIFNKFDNAGKVLIQLHEEIYLWGKWLDQVSKFSKYHSTSTKTRRLILKLIDDNISVGTLNTHLKKLNFSIFFRNDMFNIPTSLGYYMTTESCISEKQALLEALGEIRRDIRLGLINLFSNRYISDHIGQPQIELRYNYPEKINNMISFVFDTQGYPDAQYAKILRELLDNFNPEMHCSY